MNPSNALIAAKIAEIENVADQFPGVLIVHNVQSNFNKVEYMSPRGARILGVSREEIQGMGADYYSRFFNEDDAKEYVPKMIEMMQRNNEEEIYPFFQQVRSSASQPWSWYISSSKILLKDEKGMPLLLITFAVPIDPIHHLTNKVSRLLDENNFLRLHFKEFSTLTKREKELAKLLALSIPTDQIAHQLCVTIDTVKTHRKNIYRKLNINSLIELMEYARAFDLV